MDDSPLQPPCFVDDALEQPGDVSGPVLTTAGVHIIKYLGDEPGGAHVLTEEENAALENSALEAAQLEKLYGPPPAA